jgi:hypothetical protein
VATDPGGVNDPLTYAFDCNNDGVFEIGPQAAASAACVFGDNGVFTVAVRVADDDGGAATGSTLVTVTNRDPEVILSTAGAIPFPGGDAFVGQQGVPQSHDASASDPGSDDLTFSWFGGGAVHVHFNDGVSPDPPASPGPLFPFAADDSATVVFTTPGVHAVTVQVTDDDGGTASDSLPKLITGDNDCVISESHWRNRFRDGDTDHSGGGTGHGHHAHFDDATLQAFLDVIDFASAYFSELVPASTLAEAAAVFELKKVQGSSQHADAVRETFVAWLNFASGAIGLTEVIDLHPHAADAPFLTVIQAIEATLLNPAASDAAVRAARDLAKAINRHGNPAHCDD